MKKINPISDEDLTAYLDNELDSAARMKIEAALKTDQALQERLASLQFDIKDLQNAFDALSAVSPPLPDLASMTVTSYSRRFVRLALPVCLALGLVVGAGLATWQAQDKRGWMDYVAAYQALYVNATLSTVEVSDEDIATSLTSLGGVLGHDIRPAQTDSVLSFRRGQLLGYQGNSLVQLAYLSPIGDPVALCIIRLDEAATTEVAVTNLEGMAAAHWQKDGLAFLLIGGTDTALIQNAAERMAGRL